MLYVAWLLFGACILFTIWSLREAADRLAEETRFYNLIWTEELAGEISEEERRLRQRAFDESDRLLRQTRRSNRWARRTFYAGLITLMLFGILAVEERSGNEMGDKERSVQEPGEKKGYSGGGINEAFDPKRATQDETGGQQGQSGSSGDSGTSGGGGGASESEKPQTPSNTPRR